MGCDFYIINYLIVKFNNDNYLYIEISRQNMYYSYDSDDNSDDINNYKSNMLIVIKKPKILFDNKQFLHAKYENKYKQLILNEIKLPINKMHFYCFDNIDKITKEEYRMERE